MCSKLENSFVCSLTRHRWIKSFGVEMMLGPEWELKGSVEFSPHIPLSLAWVPPQIYQLNQSRTIQLQKEILRWWSSPKTEIEWPVSSYISSCFLYFSLFSFLLLDSLCDPPCLRGQYCDEISGKCVCDVTKRDVQRCYERAGITSSFSLKDLETKK